MKCIKKIIIPFGLFLFTLIIYILTLEPSVYWIDSGNFLSAVYKLSIPYPTGFPLYILLAKIFSFLPIKEFAWRVNFFSAFCSAITAVVIFYLIKQLLADYESRSQYRLFISFAGIFSVFASVFSYSFWSQSTNATPYALNWLISLFSLLAIIRWSCQKQKGIKTNFWFYLFTLSFGLGFGNHPLIIVLIPGYLFYLIANRKYLNLKLILKGAGLFLTSGLIFYLYFPLREYLHLTFSWQQPQTIKEYIEFFIGKQYQGAGATSVSNFQYMWFFFQKYINSILNRQFEDYLTYILLLFSLLGSIKIYLIKKRNFFLLFLILIFNLLTSLFYITRNRSVYFALCWLILAIFSGIGIFWIFDFLIQKKVKKIIIIATVFTFSILAVSLIIFNYPKLDKHNHYFAEDFAQNIVNNLKPDSILLVGSESDKSSHTTVLINFHQSVKKTRPDVTFFNYKIINSFNYNKEIEITANKPKLKLPTMFSIFREKDNNISLKDYNENLKKSLLSIFIIENYQKYPIYIYLPWNKNVKNPKIDGLPKDYYLKKYGLVYKITKDNNERMDFSKIKFNFHNEEFINNEPPDYLEEWDRFDYMNMVFCYQYAYAELGKESLSRNDKKEAIYYFQKSLLFAENSNSNIVKSSINLANAYLADNNPDGALAVYNKVIKELPYNNMANIYFNIAQIYQQDKKDYKKAREYYQKALTQKSSFPEVEEALKTLPQ